MSLGAGEGLAFTNARVIGPHGVVTTNVVVRDRLITAVGESPVPTDMPLLDATGMTLMPGLIDAHLHLLGIGSYDFNDWALEEPTLHAARAVRDMGALVDAGYTTVRDAGSDVSIALKRAQVDGSVRGPRVWASGRWISVTGNLPDLPHLPLDAMRAPRGMGVGVDGADECRRAVRENVRAGADIIKVATTGGIDPSFLVAESTFAESELDAIVDTAHGLGRRVTAHNNVLPGQHPGGVWRCLKAGVDAIDHGYYLPNDVLAAMAEKGTFWIVTSSYLKIVSEDGPAAGLSRIYIDKAAAAFDAVMDTIPRARRAGVKIAIGSDLLGTPVDPHGGNTLELEIMRDAGYSDAEVIDLATRVNAELLGIDEWTGAIAEEMVADLIVVDGNPDQDVSVLRDPGKVRHVLVGGVVEKGGRR